MRIIRQIGLLAKLTWLSWLSHDPTSIGAALAYYALLSLAPLVIFSIAAGGLFFGAAATEQQLVEQVRELAGPEMGVIVGTMAKQASHTASGLFASVLGIVILLVGASGVFVELRAALNAMWDVGPRETNGFSEMLRERLFSIGIVLAIGFLLVVSLLASTAIAIIGEHFKAYLALPVALLNALNFCISFLGITMLFVLILRFVPDAVPHWREVWAGGAVSAFLFTIGKTLLGLYLGHAALGSLYGAGGSAVVVTVWVFYSAQLFLFGAEFTRVYGDYRLSQDKPPVGVTGMHLLRSGGGTSPGHGGIDPGQRR